MMEDDLKKALDEAGITFGAVVEVDSVESDYLITGVHLGTRKVSSVLSGHSVPVGKSIIQRMQDLALSDFTRFMQVSEPGSSQHLDSRIEGMCECLAVMKNTSRGVEYQEVLSRYNEELQRSQDVVATVADTP